MVISYFFQGEPVARELFKSYIIHFNGIMIVGLGYGLLWFIKSSYKNAFNNLLNILELKAEQQLEIHKSFSLVENGVLNHSLSVVITIIGGFILWNCGYPSSGFAKYFIAASSISLFYVGGRMFGYLIWTVFLFKKIDSFKKKIKVQKNVSFLEFEEMSNYMSVIFLGGIIALYVAFRGTLTANFDYHNGGYYNKLLAYPIVLFLPFVLFSVFYIRYVLREIQKNQIFEKIEEFKTLISKQSNELNIKETLDLENTVLDIKEKLMSQVSGTAIIGIKDSPSILISLLLFLQFIYQNDKEIKAFITSLFGG